ncbi:hypothetical protein DOO78_17585 [Roseicella frigidaeris]|uniref:Uncharacterized protein n=1 Tax=Roseicella frigidaeris TaxID=2230885 RepID=A0A327M614_9PROT|nr:hypothetical protein DOO78_17585 [Roseicella frigidaeris]
MRLPFVRALPGAAGPERESLADRAWPTGHGQRGMAAAPMRGAAGDAGEDDHARPAEGNPWRRPVVSQFEMWVRPRP